MERDVAVVASELFVDLTSGTEHPLGLAVDLTGHCDLNVGAYAVGESRCVEFYVDISVVLVDDENRRCQLAVIHFVAKHCVVEADSAVGYSAFIHCPSGARHAVFVHVIHSDSVYKRVFARSADGEIERLVDEGVMFVGLRLVGQYGLKSVEFSFVDGVP